MVVIVPLAYREREVAREFPSCILVLRIRLESGIGDGMAWESARRDNCAELLDAEGLFPSVDPFGRLRGSCPLPLDVLESLLVSLKVVEVPWDPL